MENQSIEEKVLKPKKEIKQTRSLWSEVYEWIDAAIITVMVILLSFTFLFRQVRIDGESMESTLQSNDRVIVSNVFYTPKYGDIVVISNEVFNNKPIIKRVIATEGQWIDISGGVVSVGDTKESMKPVGSEFVGDVYTEAIINGGTYGNHEYPMQIPENKLFVMGDNRPSSLDSRAAIVGLIDERQVLGKALYRIYPFEKFGSIY